MITTISTIPQHHKRDVKSSDRPRGQKLGLSDNGLGLKTLWTRVKWPRLFCLELAGVFEV